MSFRLQIMIFSIPERNSEFSRRPPEWSPAPFTFLCRIFFFFFLRFHQHSQRFGSPRWNQQQNKPSALWSQWSLFGVLAKTPTTELYIHKWFWPQGWSPFWILRKPEKQNNLIVLRSLLAVISSVHALASHTLLTGSEKTQLTHRPVSLTPWEYVSWSCPSPWKHSPGVCVPKSLHHIWMNPDWANCTHPMPMLRSFIHSFIITRLPYLQSSP